MRLPGGVWSSACTFPCQTRLLESRLFWISWNSSHIIWVTVSWTLSATGPRVSNHAVMWSVMAPNSSTWSSVINYSFVSFAISMTIEIWSCVHYILYMPWSGLSIFTDILVCRFLRCWHGKFVQRGCIRTSQGGCFNHTAHFCRASKFHGESLI